MGSFKAGVGNVEECTPCPEGYITYQTGSVSNSSCIEETPPDSNSSVQSEASVPSVSFNFSVSGLSASDDPEKLRQQLIAARHSSAFFLPAFSAVEIALESLEDLGTFAATNFPMISQWMFSNAFVLGFPLKIF